MKPRGKEGEAISMFPMMELLWHNEIKKTSLHTRGGLVSWIGN